MNNLKKIVLFLTLLTIEQLSFGRALTETKDAYQAIISHSNANSWNGNAIQQTNANLQELENTIKSDIENTVVPAQAIPIILDILAKDPINSNVQMPLQQLLKNLETEGVFTPVAAEQNYLYSKQTRNMNPSEAAVFNADRLIEESFISPADQFAVLSFFEEPFIINIKTGAPVILNKKTGKAQNWFTVEEIVENTKWTGISLVQKTTAINALQATLNAIAIATKVAELEAGYDATKQNFYWYQNADQKIVDILNKKSAKVQIMLERVQNANTSGSGDAFNYTVTPLNNHDYMMLSADEAQSISTKYDYKALVEQGNIDRAAQLLFKQCFIAQQHHLKDANLLNADMMRIDMSQGTYIYDSFPSMDSLSSLVKNMNTGKPEKHDMLSHIRQAVQTALFIAQNEYSRFYHITDHPLVAALKYMDTQIKTDWINPIYGAGREDLNRQAAWDNLKNIGIGAVGTVVAVGAVGVGAQVYQDPRILRKATDNLIDYTTNIKTNVTNKAVEAGNYVYTGVEKGVTAAGAAATSIIPVPELTVADKVKYAAQDAKAKVVSWVTPTPANTNTDNSGSVDSSSQEYGAQAEKNIDWLNS